MPLLTFFKFKPLLICLIFISFIFTVPQTLAEENPAAVRTQLESELGDIERQIKDLESQLAVTRTEKRTLTNKINQLKTRQSALRLQIRATALQVQDLENKLTITSASIKTRKGKIELLKQELAMLIRQMQREEDQLLLNLTSDDGLSHVFRELQNFERLSIAVKRVADNARQEKLALEDKKEEFEDRQDEAERLLAIKTLQQKELGGSLGEQSALLQQTKGLESNYQSLISDNKKRAQEIRGRLYELLGGGRQINFGEAVQIANWASGLTGARAVFLLAVLTQESNLGKNVGTCNRPGDPEEKSWRNIMKPERDHEPFLKITNDLGLNPDTTPVSCPMRDRNGNRVGWGGAMGPAQFIPSTWMGYKDRVASTVGKSVANPWDIRDAFIAAGIKLKSGGANGTFEGEWRAAMIYFSGSTNTRFRFYGDSVMRLVEQYEEDINEMSK